MAFKARDTINILTERLVGLFGSAFDDKLRSYIAKECSREELITGVGCTVVLESIRSAFRDIEIFNAHPEILSTIGFMLTAVEDLCLASTAPPTITSVASDFRDLRLESSVVSSNINQQDDVIGETSVVKTTTVTKKKKKEVVKQKILKRKDQDFGSPRDADYNKAQLIPIPYPTICKLFGCKLCKSYFLQAYMTPCAYYKCESIHGNKCTPSGWFPHIFHRGDKLLRDLHRRRDKPLEFIFDKEQVRSGNYQFPSLQQCPELRQDLEFSERRIKSLTASSMPQSSLKRKAETPNYNAKRLEPPTWGDEVEGEENDILLECQ